jgi:hypothetical protein
MRQILGMQEAENQKKPSPRAKSGSLAVFMGRDLDRGQNHRRLWACGPRNASALSTGFARCICGERRYHGNETKKEWKEQKETKKPDSRLGENHFCHSCDGAR